MSIIAPVISILYQFLRKIMSNRTCTNRSLCDGNPHARRFAWPLSFGFGFYFYFSGSRGAGSSLI